MAFPAEHINPKGFLFSCNDCPWSGRDPDMTNYSIIVDGKKLQGHTTVCPKCGAFVAHDNKPVSNVPSSPSFVQLPESDSNVRATQIGGCDGDAGGAHVKTP